MVSRSMLIFGKFRRRARLSLGSIVWGADIIKRDVSTWTPLYRCVQDDDATGRGK